MKLIASLIIFCALQLSASIETIYQNHLDTSEGRAAFLTEKVIPIKQSAEKLNEEVQIQAKKIKALSPEKDQDQILVLTNEMSQKMAQLLKHLPILQSCLSIDEDFQQIDPILNQTTPLSNEQEKVLERMTSLCDQIGSL